MERFYPNEFHIDINEKPDLNDNNYLSQYDIIHYHRTLCAYEQMPNLLNKLKSMGIVTIMDLDDYWSPGQHHPAYLIIKNSKMDEKILNNIKVAENVTTTMIYLLKKLQNTINEFLYYQMQLIQVINNIFLIQKNLIELELDI